jgi:antitoxin (DNA-binding transcriptional repressor) of toxin-antitoxin stability system
MKTLNMLEAKTHLSRLVEALESGAEDEVIIARHGRPVARLTRLEKCGSGRRIGVAKGKFEVPEDIDAHNEEIAGLFSA